MASTAANRSKPLKERLNMLDDIKEKLRPFFGWFINACKFYLGGHIRVMLRHWLPLVLVALVWAFIFGGLGAGFGVPLLFRDDPAYDYEAVTWGLNRPSIAGYTAATVLLMAFLTVVYIFEVVSSTRAATSTLTAHMRRAMRFFAVAAALPLALLLVAAALPPDGITNSAPECTTDSTYCNTADKTSTKSEAASSADDATVSASASAEGDRAAPTLLERFSADEAKEALAGILIGSVIAMICGIVLFGISWCLAWLGAFLMQMLPGGLMEWLKFLLGWLRHGFSSTARREPSLVIGSFLTASLLGVFFYAVHSMGYSLAAMTRPGAAICIFLGIVVVFYFLIMVLAPSLRFLGVIGFLLVHAKVGDDLYINELPGFKKTIVDLDNGVVERTNHYDCLMPLDEKGRLVKVDDREPCDDAMVEKIQIAPGKKPAEYVPPGLLTAGEWVNLWKPKAADKGPRKLVVIATQGGAYRASFWTSLVLDQLIEKDRKGDLPGLIENVGLMTGASGGMVASAYFTVMASQGREWLERVTPQGCGMNAKDKRKWMFGPVTSKLCWDVYEATKPTNKSSKFTSPRPIARDSLTPVAAQTVLYDMRRVLTWPLTYWQSFDYLHWNDDVHHDRGLILERQWGTLDKSYGELARMQQSLRDREKRHPSMIISPMIADTGQPILISNLDLKGLVDSGSGEAVSMFKWFPDIRDDFRVQTAVRMNASFPYISPAVSLPTTLRRRVVDAGYYDNYGVNTAVSWLFQKDVMDVLADDRQGIDGLILVQIRAFQGRDQGQFDPADTERKLAKKDLVPHDKEPHKSDLPLIPEWMTSPLAGALSARSGSMAYRNDAQVDRLKRMLKARGRDDDFVESVIFENRVDTNEASVSWHITPNELRRLECELKSKWNKSEFERLKTVWNRGTPNKQNEQIAMSSEDPYDQEPAAGPMSFCKENAPAPTSVASQ